jgi:hypothetical protein
MCFFCFLFFFLLVRVLLVFTFIIYSKYVQNVICMGNVNVRVPEELKGRMKRCKSVNWSEVARMACEDAARKEETECAAEAIKTLRLESKAEWDGAKEIRRWRDAAKSRNSRSLY